MNFLVIGSGAREHIIAEKLDVVGANVFSVLTNMNPGLLNISKKYFFAKNYKLSMESIVAFASTNFIDCVVIGPEDPLALGLSDLLWKKGIPVVGPLKKLAQIETSKGFTRDLLNKLGTDIDFSQTAFPFMALREGRVANIPARVIRVSFTGELSFEINVSR